MNTNLDWLGAVAVVIGHLLLLLAVAGLLLLKGRLIAAGVAWMIVSLIPLFWQANFTDSDMPGFGALLLLTFPPGFLLFLAGLGRCAFRFGRQMFSRKDTT